MAGYTSRTSSRSSRSLSAWALADMLVEFAGVDVVDLDAILDGLYACRVEAKVLAVYVVNTLELVAVTDRPA